MREDAATKGKRYLVEGRLRVLEASEDGGYALALCRGSGAEWTVTYEDRRWACDCPAFRTCAHVVALQAVFYPEPRR